LDWAVVPEGFFFAFRPMAELTTYECVLSVAIFLVAVWCASRVSKKIGIPSIVLEVMVGLAFTVKAFDLLPRQWVDCGHQKNVLCASRITKERFAMMGPSVCDLDKYIAAGTYATPWQDGFWGNSSRTVVIDGRTYELDAAATNTTVDKVTYSSYETCLVQACDAQRLDKCGTSPDIFAIVGHAGLVLSYFDAGLHTNLRQLGSLGPVATGVAGTGTFLPLVFGAGLLMEMGYELVEAVSIGVALVPTGAGIALQALQASGTLNTDFGQAIVNAAFMDNILSCIAVLGLFHGPLTMDIVVSTNKVPKLVGVAIMGILAACGIVLFPNLLKSCFAKVRERHPERKLSTHQEVLLVLMIVILAIYTQLLNLAGLHLWGTYLAGITFAAWPGAAEVWARQAKRHTLWMVRIFYAAVVPFAIPIDDLFTLEALWKGAILGVVPCIGGKVFCALLAGDSRWVIGWGMATRGEFAILVAHSAYTSVLVGPKSFCIVLWALVCGWVIPPFIFRRVLQRYLARQTPSELAAQRQPTLDRIESLPMIMRANAKAEPEPVEITEAPEEATEQQETTPTASEPEDGNGEVPLPRTLIGRPQGDRESQLVISTLQELLRKLQGGQDADRPDPPADVEASRVAL